MFWAGLILLGYGVYLWQGKIATIFYAACLLVFLAFAQQVGENERKNRNQ
jgi:hypothetical protein